MLWVLDSNQGTHCIAIVRSCPGGLEGRDRSVFRPERLSCNVRVSKCAGSSQDETGRADRNGITRYCRASRAPSTHWSTAEESSDSCEEIGENRPTLSGPSSVSFLPTLSAVARALLRPARGSSGSPRTPGTGIARAAVLGMRLRGCGCGCKVCSTRLPRAEAAMPLIGGFTRSNHTARTTSLARPEDTKNSWLSQSLLRPLSIVFISRGICKPPWPMAAPAPALSPPSTPPQGFGVETAVVPCPLLQRPGPVANGGRRSCDSSARRATDAILAEWLRQSTTRTAKSCYAGQQHSSDVLTADARKGAVS